MTKLKLVPALLVAGLPLFALAQKEKEKKDTVENKAVTKTDSTKHTTPPGIKKYEDVITSKAITRNGMFSIHQIDEQFFFELPDSVLNRDILVVGRVSKAPAGVRPKAQVYAGDQIVENVIRFEKAPFDRIVMKRMQFAEKSADTTENGLYRSVINSNLQSIVASFPVKATKGENDKKNFVVDATSFLQSDNEIFYFAQEAKKAFGIGGIQNDKSYVSGFNAFPRNVEIKTIRTYLPAGGGAIPVTYELNSSLLLLPKVPMQPRFADARIGFFSRGVVDFDADPQRVTSRFYVTRWRLEPKEEDKEKYLAGELVEPKNPIIYYIDPATPKKWVPYLIAGVNDWQKAFEQAGFKNAIKALPAPENDSTWSIDDARHNVLVYKPSAIPNASGPHVHDPRSGEIMETHINWYHNVMELVHHWYMIQAGAVDPRARKMQFDDSLMGELIRFVSSHEVGHTLGLMHNFGASSTVSVEKLRDKKWVEANGHTPSIMDYARFNYVAQPEDGISEKGIFPRIGAYDKWAIEYGYRWFPQFKTPEAETPYLNNWIVNSMKRNKQLFFGYEMLALDPRSQSEDLGDDATLASMYGIKNLQRILPQLPSWTRTANEGYDNLKNLTDILLRQYNVYTAHVLKIVGGQYITPKSVEQSGAVFEPVPYEKQKAAMKFLNTYVFNSPTWLTTDTTFKLTGSSPDLYLGVGQSNVIMRLLGSGTISRLMDNELKYPNQKVYTYTDLLTDLKAGVWTELYSGKPISADRRGLQRMYIDRAFSAFKMTGEIFGANYGTGLQLFINPDPTRTDVTSVMRAHLIDLNADIKKAIAVQRGLAKYHLQDMSSRIEKALKDGNKEPGK